MKKNPRDRFFVATIIFNRFRNNPTKNKYRRGTDRRLDDYPEEGDAGDNDDVDHDTE